MVGVSDELEKPPWNPYNRYLSLCMRTSSRHRKQTGLAGSTAYYSLLPSFLQIISFRLAYWCLMVRIYVVTIADTHNLKSASKIYLSQLGASTIPQLLLPASPSKAMEQNAISNSIAVSYDSEFQPPNIQTAVLISICNTYIHESEMHPSSRSQKDRRVMNQHLNLPHVPKKRISNLGWESDSSLILSELQTRPNKGRQGH